MKKHSILIVFLLVILIIGFIAFYNVSDKRKTYNNKNRAYKTYLENDSGDYVLTDDMDFPTDGYTLNTEKTTCTNGGEISQNEDKTLNLSVGKGTRCKLYFSKNSNLKEQLLLNNGGKKEIEAKAIPDLTQSAVGQSYYDSLPNKCDGTTSWCESKDRAVVENGLYAKADDYGTSYYFRG